MKIKQIIESNYEKNTLKWHNFFQQAELGFSLLDFSASCCFNLTMCIQYSSTCTYQVWAAGGSTFTCKYLTFLDDAEDFPSHSGSASQFIFSKNLPPWGSEIYRSISRSLHISLPMLHTRVEVLHHITSTCSSVHPDLMGSGRTEPQLKPLIVPRPPAHRRGKWRSMRGKMISCSPRSCSLLLTTENLMQPRKHWRNSRLQSEGQYREFKASSSVEDGCQQMEHCAI